MSDDLSGRTLGRYQVLERLGRGGMAEVYRAYQPSLDRYVAIKVIYPHLASDPDLLERFGREARAVAALHHPNIVQVHDFDVQSGTAFMAMEFISGPTLKAAIQSLHQRGQLLPLPVVGQIIGQLADALGYAHEQKVIHRDVKPANVMIRHRSPPSAPIANDELDALMLGVGPTSIVLTDFGVARMVKDSVEHTAAGTILGSPAYMSPEQGRGERVGPASDIYSLGIVLYELLTGQVPFDADTPFAIVIKHSTAPLPPPRRLRPDLPDRVEQVLLKALAKDPQDRFSEASAFGAALREATASEAPTGPLGLTPIPTVPAGRAADPWPSRETRVVEITAAAAPPPQTPTTGATQAIGALSSAGGPQRRPLSPMRTILIALGALAIIVLVTVAAFVAGGALVFRGLGQAGALVVPTKFSQQATVAAAQGTVLPFGPTTPGPTATVDRSDPVAVALDSGLTACAGPGCRGGDPAKALAIYSAALAQRPDSAALLAARAQLYVWWDASTYTDQARADIAAALAIDKENAAAYLARGELAQATADGDTARKAALDDISRAIELDPALLGAYLARARLLAGAPNFYGDTSPSRDQVIADTTKIIASDATSIEALNLRADAYNNAGRPDESLADTNAVLGLDPKDLDSLMRRAGLNRYHYEKNAAAIADYAAVIAIDAKNHDAHEGRGALLAAAGDYKGALADAQALVEIDPTNASSYVFRGFTLLALGRAPEAQRDFEDAKSVGDPQAVDMRYGHGLALLAQNKADEAIPDLEAAYKKPDDLWFIRGAFTGNHNRTGIDLARAYIAAGRAADAAPIIDNAVAQNEDWYLPYLMRARYRRAAGDLPGARVDLRSAASRAASDAERAEVAQEQGP